MSPLTTWTIGHSTHSIPEFADLLARNGVTQVVDVRTVARSRHNPQFNEDTLPDALVPHGIDYRRIAALGGLRHTTKASVNTGWHNASFRGYADYMQTPEFIAGLVELHTFATARPTAIMCAEAVPWRCHRSLIGDALLIRGVHVVDIIGPASVRDETITPFAHVDGLTITYPPET
ncbi:MAG: DUF488 domain-containing protein [Microbacterium sp.]